MTGPAAELQTAIFQVLDADADLQAMMGIGKVHDLAPAHTQFPYITFGKTSVYDWSTGTETGTEQLFTLHVWSKVRGKAEALAIMDRVEICLHEADLQLDMHHLVSLRRDYAEVAYDDDISLHHGMLRFRAVTEPTV